VSRQRGSDESAAHEEASGRNERPRPRGAPATTDFGVVVVLLAKKDDEGKGTTDRSEPQTGQAIGLCI